MGATVVGAIVDGASVVGDSDSVGATVVGANDTGASESVGATVVGWCETGASEANPKPRHLSRLAINTEIK